jgi:hypothetical protein
MDPSTVTTTATSTSQTLQQLQAQATQQAQIVGQNFLSIYFSNLTWLEVLSVFITLILVAAIIYYAIETGWYANRVDRFKHIILQSDMSKEHGQEAWRHIQEAFFKGSENDLKVSIMDADKLLNEALREAGIVGSHLGDRLKKASSGQIPNLNDVWQAHKLRNQIAHEPNFKLKRDLAERALSIYQVALKNLGIFDEETLPPTDLSH